MMRFSCLHACIRVNDAELAHAQIPQLSFYLLRPDGHVGICGTHLNVAAIKRYLSAQMLLHI